MSSDELAYPVPHWYARERPVFGIHLPVDPIDDAGRPLMEWASRLPQREGSRVSCPYADSRSSSRLPMNVDALKEFRNQEQRAYEWLGAFVQQVRSHYPSASTPERVWLVCTAITTYTLSFGVEANLRQSNAAPPLDASLCSLQKIARGLATLVETWCDSQGPDSDFASADAIYALANKEHALTGRVEVCAAPPAYIQRFLSRLLTELSNTGSHDQVTLAHTQSPRMQRLAIPFTSLFVQARFASYLYEYARVWVLTRVGSTLGVAGRTRMERASAPRHTTAYGQYAHRDGQSAQRLWGPHAQTCSRLVDLLSDPTSRGLWHSFRQSLQMLAVSSNEQLALQWPELRKHALALLNHLNEGLGGLFPVDARRLIRLDDKDLRIFFGDGIDEVSPT